MKLSQLLALYDHDQLVEVRNDDGILYWGLCQDTPPSIAMHKHVLSFRAVVQSRNARVPYINANIPCIVARVE